jgi:hypothetical protein
MTGHDLPAMLEPFKHIPLILAGLPIFLAVLDGIYKRAIFGHPPYDGVADISLTALTFSGVHLITKSMSPDHHLMVQPVVILVVIGQAVVWPLALGWGKALRDAKSGIGIALSYAAGVLWFLWTVGWLLLLVPA